MPAAFLMTNISDLIAYYRLEENGNDYSGNGYHMTEYYAVSYVPGKRGNALSLSGGGWLINLDDNLSRVFEKNNPYSIVLWFKTATTTWDALLAANQIGFGYDMVKISINEQTITNGHIIVGREQDGTNRTILETSISYRDDIWHMIAVTYDGSTFTLNMDNGSEIVSSAAPESAAFANDIRVGSTSFDQKDPDEFSTNGEEYNGLIDELAMFERAITTDEINRIYTEGITKKKRIKNVRHKDTTFKKTHKMSAKISGAFKRVTI